MAMIRRPLYRAPAYKGDKLKELTGAFGDVKVLSKTKTYKEDKIDKKTGKIKHKKGDKVELSGVAAKNALKAGTAELEGINDVTASIAGGFGKLVPQLAKMAAAFSITALFEGAFLFILLWILYTYKNIRNQPGTLMGVFFVQPS